MDWKVFEPLLPALVQFLVVAIGACGAVVTFYVRKWVNKTLENETVSRLNDEIQKTVHALEQKGLLIGWDGEQKKEAAMVILMQIRDALGAPVTDNDLDRAIEAYVNMMNQMQPPEFAIAELAETVG